MKAKTGNESDNSVEMFKILVSMKLDSVAKISILLENVYINKI